MQNLVLMCIFLEYLPFINFWDKFHPKICCSPYENLWKFSIEIWQTYLSQIKAKEASQGCRNLLINKRFYCFYDFNFAHKQALNLCAYICMYMYLCLEPHPNSLYYAEETVQCNFLRIQCVWLGLKDQVTISLNAKL